MITLSDALNIMRKVDAKGQPIPFLLEYDPYNQDSKTVGARRTVTAVMDYSNATQTKAYNNAHVAKAVDGVKQAPKRLLNKFQKGIITIKILDGDKNIDAIRFVHTMCMVRLNKQLIKLHIHG